MKRIHFIISLFLVYSEHYLVHLYLIGCNLAKFDPYVLCLYKGMTTLRELNVSRCLKVTDAGIRHLLSIPTLEKLCIAETGITAHGVTLLSSLKTLVFLDLGGLPVTDQALSSLQVFLFSIFNQDNLSTSLTVVPILSVDLWLHGSHLMFLAVLCHRHSLP